MYYKHFGGYVEELSPLLKSVSRYVTPSTSPVVLALPLVLQARFLFSLFTSLSTFNRHDPAAISYTWLVLDWPHTWALYATYTI